MVFASSWLVLLRQTNEEMVSPDRHTDRLTNEQTTKRPNVEDASEHRTDTWSHRQTLLLAGAEPLLGRPFVRLVAGSLARSLACLASCLASFVSTLLD